MFCVFFVALFFGINKQLIEQQEKGAGVLVRTHLLPSLVADV